MNYLQMLQTRQFKAKGRSWNIKIQSTVHAVCRCCQIRFINSPPSCCVYESHLCSSPPHVFHWTLRQRVRICALLADTAVRLPVSLYSITWTQWGRVRVEWSCVKGRNNHASPALTLGMTELCERLPSAPEEELVVLLLGSVHETHSLSL